VSILHLLEGTASDIRCWGCDPSCGDRPRVVCDCCGGQACLVVPCDAGWRSLNGAAHAVSYCSHCWNLLLTVRKRHTPPPGAHALNLEGEQLLRRQPEPIKKPRARRRVA
jgi:hypothetical protein